MALTTPTIDALNATIISQLEAKFGESIPILPKSWSRVAAKAFAGAIALVYKYAGFSHLQQYIQHASFQETTVNGVTLIPLVEIGRALGVGDPEPATNAELTITVNVTEVLPDEDLAAGSFLIRESTAVIYSVVEAVPLSASTITATIRAVDDDRGNFGAGEIGNLSVSDELSFANPLPYVERIVTVASVVTTAADAESEATYRARVLRRSQRKLQGGAAADYQAWAEEVPSILSAYPYASDSPGEVDVYIESSVETDGIPTSDELAAAVTSMTYDPDTGDASRKPITAALNVYPITRKSLNVEVTGLVVSESVSVLADASTAVDEYMRQAEPFILGLSTLPRTDRIIATDVGFLVSDVVRAAGGTFTSVILKDGTDTISAYTLDRGEKAKLGTLSSV